MIIAGGVVWRGIKYSIVNSTIFCWKYSNYAQIQLFSALLWLRCAFISLLIHIFQTMTLLMRWKVSQPIQLIFSHAAGKQRICRSGERNLWAWMVRPKDITYSFWGRVRHITIPNEHCHIPKKIVVLKSASLVVKALYLSSNLWLVLASYLQ